MIECVKLRRGLPHGKAVLTFCGTACVLHVFYADERVYISTTFYRVLLFSTTRPVLESKLVWKKQMTSVVLFLPGLFFKNKPTGPNGVCCSSGDYLGTHCDKQQR
jgi:hypothetical protein